MHQTPEHHQDLYIPTTLKKKTMPRSNHNYRSTGSPFPNARTANDVLKAFATALDEIADLRNTLSIFDAQYLKLETEHRDLIDTFIASREETMKWEKLCRELREEKKKKKNAGQAVEVQKNGRFAKGFLGGKKVAEIWNKGGEFFCIWEEKAGGSGGWSVGRIVEDLSERKEKWQRRWCEWRVRRREANARSAELAEAWREGY